MNLLKKIQSKLENVLHLNENKALFNFDNKDFMIEMIDDGGKYIVTILQPKEGDDLVETIILNKSTEHYVTLHKKELSYCTAAEFSLNVIEWVFNIYDKDKLDRNIQGIIKHLFYGLYSNDSYESMHKILDEYETNPTHLLLYLFKEALLLMAKFNKNESEMQSFVNGLINSQYIVLKKVALYVIGNNIQKFINLFWSALDSNDGSLIFQEGWFEDELRVILENIIYSNQEQKDKLNNVIQKGPTIDHESEDLELEIKIWKQKRLRALSKDPNFNKLYLELKEETKLDVEMGPMIGNVESGYSFRESPLKIEDLLKMSNSEIALFISEFKTNNFWEGPSTEGLAGTLREFTKNNTDRIVKDIQPFINIGYYYVYEIIYGFIDAWNDKKTFDWDKLLNFINNYIKRSSFWNGTYQMNFDTRDVGYKWILTAISDLITAGTQNDDWAFSENHLNLAKDIVIYILNNIKDIKEEKNGDFVSHVLNSVTGRNLNALLNISLRFKRINLRKQEVNSHWDNDLKEVFTNYLNEDISDAYVKLGFNLPNFMYLDKDWCKSQISIISYDNPNWEGFMIGYISRKSIYKDIYLLMKEHYKKGIYYSFNEKGIKADLANHIAVGYLSGYEDTIGLELYNELICKWDYEMIQKVLWYFWAQRKELDKSENKKLTEEQCEKIREKITDFWDVLYNRYKSYNATDFKEEDKKIISDSLKLVETLDEINEEKFERIKFAIPYAEFNYNSHEVIEGFNKIISNDDSTQKKVMIGELIYELAKNCAPTYPQETIIKLVNYLYNSETSEPKEIADRICNTYVQRNINFFKDICLQNRDY